MTFVRLHEGHLFGRLDCRRVTCRANAGDRCPGWRAGGNQRTGGDRSGPADAAHARHADVTRPARGVDSREKVVHHCGRAGRGAVGQGPSLDLDPEGGGAPDDLRIAPPGELVILDQEEQIPDAVLAQGLEVTCQLAPVDATRVAGRCAVLAGQDRHAEPPGATAQLGRIEPVDA